MKNRVSLAILICILFCVQSFGYKVDVTELENSKKIIFINYEGKREAPFSPVQRIGIGRTLADLSTGDNRYYNYFLFSIMHAVNPGDTNGMDADIFSVLQGARI